MSKITMDNLSDNLKAYMDSLGLSEEQVLELIKNNISGDLAGLNTTDKSSLVAAINELFQNANNGKELIATAIGEPLNSSDTFSAMSTGINGLNSQFKAALMNNGVSVAGTDKFKQLIEKLALLADNENTGINYIEGEGNIDRIGYDSDSMLRYGNSNITDLPFIPTYVFVILNTNPVKSSSVNLYNITMSSILSIQYGALSCSITINNNSFNVSYHSQAELNSVSFKWYAIGVGEEDTTLEDSLRDILGNKGVEVTEEDDLASLITKVDSIQENRYPVWYNPENTWMSEKTSKLNINVKSYRYTTSLGDYIYIFNTNAFCTYNTITNVCSASTSYTNLPSNSELSRGDFTVVTCGGLIYFVGGLKEHSSDRQNANNYLMSYNPSNGAWASKANMTTALNQALACVYNNKIYVFGGRTYKEYYSGTYLYGYSPKASVYDPISDTWTSITEVPKYKVANPVVVNNCAYLPSTAGGTSSRYKYDFNTDTYTEITTGLNLAVCTVYKDRIYQFYTTSAKMYSTLTETETDKTVCPTDKADAASHTMGNLIYYMGGVTKNSNGNYTTAQPYGNIYIPER